MPSKNVESDSQHDLSTCTLYLTTKEDVEDSLMKYQVLRKGATKEYTRLVTYHDHVSSFCRDSYCNKQVLLITTGKNDLFCVICGRFM